MARSRNLKPGFFKNDQLAECGAIGMVTFAGLWCLADCNGNLEYRPRRIKAEVIPYFDDDMDSILNSLAARGFIHFYGPTGSEYLHIINFEKHQNPHKKEKDAGSEIPTPVSFQEKPENDQVEIDADRLPADPAPEAPEPDPEIPGLVPGNPDPAGLIPDSLLLIPDSRANLSAAAAASSSPRGDEEHAMPYKAIVDLYHQELPNLPAVKVLSQKRKAAIRQRHVSLMQRCSERWRAYFQAVSRSDFLTGRVEGKTWRADFDFLLTEKAVVGVIEGKYFDCHHRHKELTTPRATTFAQSDSVAGAAHGCHQASERTRDQSLQEDLRDTSWAD